MRKAMAPRTTRDSEGQNFTDRAHPAGSVPRIHTAKQRRRSNTAAASKERLLARFADQTASPLNPEELRAHRRYEVAATSLRVIWLDTNGDMKVENSAQPIDVSETGMAVQLPEPALLLSRIRLESEQGELIGHGKVRSCHAAGQKYITGIEFTDSLRWSAPDGPINEPIPLTSPTDEEESAPLGGSEASPAAATEVPEELLWSEELERTRPVLGTETTQSAETVEPASSSLA